MKTMIINCTAIRNNPAIIEQLIGQSFVLEDSNDSSSNYSKEDGILLEIKQKPDKYHTYFPIDVLFLKNNGDKSMCYLDIDNKWQLKIIDK